jgi:hypothetical protein
MAPPANRSPPYPTVATCNNTRAAPEHPPFSTAASQSPHQSQQRSPSTYYSWRTQQYSRITYRSEPSRSITSRTGSFRPRIPNLGYGLLRLQASWPLPSALSNHVRIRSPSLPANPALWCVASHHPSVLAASPTGCVPIPTDFSVTTSKPTHRPSRPRFYYKPTTRRTHQKRSECRPKHQQPSDCCQQRKQSSAPSSPTS